MWFKPKAPRGSRKDQNRFHVELLEGRALPSASLPDLSTSTTIDLGATPTSSVAADFNADGKLDIATTISGGLVSISLGNGDGTFQTPLTFAADTAAKTSEAISIAVGDFNGDNKPDIVTSNFGNNRVSVLLNTSSGGTLNFAAPVSYGAGTDTVAVAVADLNGDNKLDLVTANIGAEAKSSLGVLLGNGDGTFQPVTFVAAGANPNNLAIGDLNGDNIPDLAVTYSANTGLTANKVGVLLGKGDGTFGIPTLISVGETPSSVTMADFNGDHKLDLAVTNFNSGTVSILLNNGNASFTTKKAGTYDVGGKPLSAVAADFNGDGKMDLAVASQGTDQVTILLGNGNGTFHSGSKKQLVINLSGTPAGEMAVGDFNGDSLPDLAVPIVENGTLDVFLSHAKKPPKPINHGHNPPPPQAHGHPQVPSQALMHANSHARFKRS